MEGRERKERNSETLSKVPEIALCAAIIEQAAEDYRTSLEKLINLKLYEKALKESLLKSEWFPRALTRDGWYRALAAYASEFPDAKTSTLLAGGKRSKAKQRFFEICEKNPGFAMIFGVIALIGEIETKIRNEKAAIRDVEEYFEGEHFEWHFGRVKDDGGAPSFSGLKKTMRGGGMKEVADASENVDYGMAGRYIRQRIRRETLEKRKDDIGLLAG